MEYDFWNGINQNLGLHEFIKDGSTLKYQPFIIVNHCHIVGDLISNLSLKKLRIIENQDTSNDKCFKTW